MSELKIEYLLLKDIRPYKNNVKQHPQWQIDKIIQSIKKFGFNDPIAVDENGVIIEGHGRYLASEQMGKKKVPCIVLDGLTKDQKRAYIIAHNKLNMDTGFDIKQIKKEIRAIKDADFNLSFLDFDSSMFDDILDVNDDDFIQGNEYVKKKFIIKIECDNEEQMEKRKAKLRKAGWL